MVNRKPFLVVLGVILAVVVVAASADAWWSGARTTHLTFKRAVLVPGATLPPGSYVFEMITPEVVRVSNRRRTGVYVTAFTRQTFRPAGTVRDQLVTFGEAPAGSAPPIKAWFPPESSVGHEFIYSR
jgi:hypothetical protein